MPLCRAAGVAFGPESGGGRRPAGVRAVTTPRASPETPIPALPSA